MIVRRCAQNHDVVIHKNTKPGMRKRLFNRIKAGGKGGAPGQWSARKAQMLASAYKKAGGGYKS